MRVTLKPRFGNPDLAAFTRSRHLDGRRRADHRALAPQRPSAGTRLTLRNPSRRKRSAYLVVYIGQRTKALDSRYQLRVQRVKR